MKFPAGDLFIFIFFLIGVLFISIAYYLYYSHQQLVQHGVATKGVVIDMHRMKPREYPMAPSIRYHIRDGCELVFHSSEGRNPPAYEIGDEVTLYYDPAKPENVQLDGDYLMVYVMGGMGAVFLLLSIWSVPESTVAIWKWLFTR
ncbi:DUF3592 domain-containing protein [Spirosoma sp. KCTC 42546]|uniref:DUF3592 domain-containing protein n=1 Tax=Spirosoma sp. KCTC 42546 TaxID=2520506 RepID=UPI001158D89E|nr:DUF3592 domain-containing protein [Spirosoma sp. KCTC 42546]QDK79420.1 DUF3592 domain-containing protein [Spirosoma sp. KCTC 42546]